MTKEEIIDLIDSRIKSEYRKHKDLDWSKIAAHKIYGSLVKLFAIPDVIKSVCDCGKPIDSRYAPCCSLNCWSKKFE